MTGACGPEADAPPPAQGRAVATYRAPSAYRVGSAELRRITDGLEPDSPQRAMLADGRVSRAEVDQAWTGYAGCMRSAGFVVTASAWDPVTGTARIFTFARADGATATTDGVPTPTTASTAAPKVEAMTPREGEQVDACEERHWFPVSAIYAADTPPHLERRLAAALAECMAGRGYAATAVTDFGGLVGAVGGEAQGARVQAGRDCLASVLPALYPDLPYYPRP